MHSNSTWQQVTDGARRRIRGLWFRNGSYYVQTTLQDARSGRKVVRRLRLEGATTAAEARAAAATLVSTIRQTGTIHGKAGPTFAEYREHYDKHNLKAPKTRYDEGQHLKYWQAYLGDGLRITEITSKHVLNFRTDASKRLKARSINLYVGSLKSMLKLAQAESIITDLPFNGVKKLKEVHREKELLSSEDIHAVVREALEHHSRTGKQFADFILLLAYCGGRVSETLKLQWKDVEWETKQLVFRGDNTKNSLTRRVNFNRNLENHLQCMLANRSSDTYLFPSNRTDKPTTSFKILLQRILTDIKMDKQFTFHSLRHYFISQGVMKGLDFLTIARWAGHKDGGILIGKVYGHLSNDHLVKQAESLTF